MTTRKTGTMALTTLLVFVMLFSLVFVIAEADHDCSGEDCPVCEIIAIVSDTTKGLFLIGSVALIFATILVGIGKLIFIENKDRTVFSPISLKVKLSN